MSIIAIMSIVIGSAAIATLCTAVWCAAVLCTSKLAKCVHAVERESSDLRRVHASLLNLVKSEKEERVKLGKERVNSVSSALREYIRKTTDEFDRAVFKHDIIKELVKRRYPGLGYINRAQVLEFLVNELARRMAEDSVSPVMQKLASNTALSGVVEDIVMARPCNADFVGTPFTGKMEAICNCVNSIPDDARDRSAEEEETIYDKLIELAGLVLGTAYNIRPRRY